jgi:pimeloyl-ACP methyl ester carboxylesterase
MLFAAVTLAAEPRPVAPATPAPVTAAPPTPPAASPVSAPAPDPEVRVTADLTQRLTTGHAVELQVGDRKVLGLLAEQTAPKAKGVVLLLHDLGGHADWPGVIGEMRRALPAQGWTTFALQLPVPGNLPPAEQWVGFLDQSAARVGAAVAYLKASHTGDLVLAGHGVGALAALDYSVAHANELTGLVLVGTPHLRNADPRTDAAAALARLQGPVLDIYGSADRLEVVASAAARRAAARTNSGYSEIVQPGADHFFRNQEQLLAKRVRGWLERRAQGQRLAITPAPRSERAPEPASPTPQAPQQQPKQSLTPQGSP